jgi:hypothetical protein
VFFFIGYGVGFKDAVPAAPAAPVGAAGTYTLLENVKGLSTTLFPEDLLQAGLRNHILNGLHAAASSPVTSSLQADYYQRQSDFIIGMTKSLQGNVTIKNEDTIPKIIRIALGTFLPHLVRGVPGLPKLDDATLNRVIAEGGEYARKWIADHPLSAAAPAAAPPVQSWQTAQGSLQGSNFLGNLAQSKYGFNFPGGAIRQSSLPTRKVRRFSSVRRQRYTHRQRA